MATVREEVIDSIRDFLHLWGIEAVAVPNGNMQELWSGSCKLVALEATSKFTWVRVYPGCPDQVRGMINERAGDWIVAENYLPSEKRTPGCSIN